MLLIRSAVILGLALPAAVAQDSEAASADESAAIERCVLDYAESYYEVKPEYAERSISKDLVKVGYTMRDGEYVELTMDHAGFLGMVQWFVDQEKIPDPGPKDVVILDAMDTTALVKLTGSWGIDYMQLEKTDAGWQTRHVVWQSLPPERSAAEQDADVKAVAAACHDYLDALYHVKPELLERSVAKHLAKYGYWRKSPEDDYRTFPMTYDELAALAGEWNVEGRVDTDGPRSVKVVEVMDRVACAMVSADWGVDYMHLTKVDGRWQIVQILWQSHPPTRS